MKKFCLKKKYILYGYLRKLFNIRTECASIFRSRILNYFGFRMRLQIVFRSILHTFPPIASQLVNRQFFEERPSLLGLALTPFPFALTVRYLGIRGRLADAASGGSLPNRIQLENHIVIFKILLFTDFKRDNIIYLIAFAFEENNSPSSFFNYHMKLC